MPILLLSASARAQDTPPPAPTPPATQPAPDLAALEARIAELQSAPEDPARDALLAMYRDALDALRKRDEAEARRAESERLTASAPALLASIRAELANPPAEPSIAVPEGATLTQIEQGLADAQARLATAREAADVLTAEAARRAERQPIIAAQINDLRRRLAETGEAYAAIPDTDDSEAARANRIRLAAREANFLAEIAAIEREALSYTARADLLPARRDLALRKITEAQRLVDAWQARVTKAKQDEARRAAEEAERLQQQAAQHPVLKEFADENTRLANLRVGPQGTSARPATYEAQAKAVQRALADLRAGYQSVQARIRASDLNRATGLLLRNQYADLQEPATLRRDLTNDRRLLEQAELRRIDLEESRDAVGDINRVVEELLEDIADFNRTNPAQYAPVDRAALEAVARDLATNRLDTLDSLLIDADNEVRALFDLTENAATYLDAVIQYSAYIEERILWIRSIANENLDFGRNLARSTAWLFNPRDWEAALDQIARSALETWSPVAGAVLLVALTYLVRRLAVRRLLHLSKLVGNYKTDSLRLTFRALFFTLAASIFLPVLIHVVGWLLKRPTDQLPVAVAVGQAFTDAVILVLVLSFSRAAVRRGGLFASHFRWPNAAVAHLRRELRWFMPVVIPLVILTNTFQIGGDEGMIATAGRIVFTAHMIALAVLIRDIFRPAGPTMAEYLKRTQFRVIRGSRYIWYGLVILTPLALAGMSWFGYHYTAIALFTQVQHSLFLVVILVTIYALMLRWLFVARRDVAIETARRRREQAQSDADSPESPGPVVDEDRLDLPAISAQTQQIFGLVMAVAVIVGLFTIWAPVLPALRMLDRVEIYPTARVVSAEEDQGVPVLEKQLPPTPGETKPQEPTPPETTPPTNGAKPSVPPGVPPLAAPESETPAAQPAAEPIVISLADIGLAIVIIVATVLAFKNLPGLFEILVLHRLPLDAGIRYALSTVLRYVIAIIGISIAFSAIGLAWENIQWLAAALTFGLAFGLQEIFANFVSGLIILAERPVRIGDTVTVGTVTGDVSRIRMRATTITDWERKELIIPNKSFITGDVINWTLTDPILRVSIPVGVAYSSDVDKVERVLLRIANADPVVLKTPAPYVLFKAFGDSTLDFELRVFIPSIKSFVEVRHRLHMTIMKTFTAEEIEIAFPQRDLHIRSADAELLIKHAKPVDRPPTEEPPPTPETQA